MVIELIPSLWLAEDGKRAFWPPSGTDAQSAVKHRCNPEEDWKLWDICEVMATEGKTFIITFNKFL